MAKLSLGHSLSVFSLGLCLLGPNTHSTRNDISYLVVLHECFKNVSSSSERIKISCFSIPCIKYALLSRSISLSVDFFGIEVKNDGFTSS